MQADECIAIRGATILDVINPATGLTAIYGKTLADCQCEEPTAERMTIDEFCQGKAALQDAPVVWEPVSEERYDEMLEVLPPAAYGSGGFLVGEPWDHHTLTGRPRYQAFIKRGHEYLTSNRPMTKAEFGEYAKHYE